MGDTATRQSLSGCRALWSSPLREEEGAPPQRIIHARVLQLHAPARLGRLGIRKSAGYHKCGSRQDLDWVTALRVLIFLNPKFLHRLARPYGLISETLRPALLASRQEDAGSTIGGPRGTWHRVPLSLRANLSARSPRGRSERLRWTTLISPGHLLRSWRQAMPAKSDSVRSFSKSDFA